MATATAAVAMAAMAAAATMFEPAPRVSYVYVLVEVGTGAFKVGTTFDVFARVASAQLDNPREVRLLTARVGGRAEERALWSALAGHAFRPAGRGHWYAGTAEAHDALEAALARVCSLPAPREREVTPSMMLPTAERTDEERAAIRGAVDEWRQSQQR